MGRKVSATVLPVPKASGFLARRDGFYLQQQQPATPPHLYGELPRLPPFPARGAGVCELRAPPEANTACPGHSRNGVLFHPSTRKLPGIAVPGRCNGARIHTGSLGMSRRSPPAIKQPADDTSLQREATPPADLLIYRDGSLAGGAAKDDGSLWGDTP